MQHFSLRPFYKPRLDILFDIFFCGRHVQTSTGVASCAITLASALLFFLAFMSWHFSSPAILLLAPCAIALPAAGALAFLATSRRIPWHDLRTASFLCHENEPKIAQALHDILAETIATTHYLCAADPPCAQAPLHGIFALFFYTHDQKPVQLLGPFDDPQDIAIMHQAAARFTTRMQADPHLRTMVFLCAHFLHAPLSIPIIPKLSAHAQMRLLRERQAHQEATP